MLRIRRLLAALAVAAFASPALAQSPTPAPPAPKADDAKRNPDGDTAKGIDSLFERLGKLEDAEEAKGIANLIERRWNRSGSDTADLLMSRVLTVMQPKDQDLPQAIELLDRIISLEPNWTEAYNKRATALYAIGDFQRSLLDVSTVLAREPRHYGALAGLGHILLQNGDKKRAMEAFRKVLAIYPSQEDIKKMVERLKPDVDGRDT
jgi:tetratricopeptide (TPR) repeat protein